MSSKHRRPSGEGEKCLLTSPFIELGLSGPPAKGDVTPPSSGELILNLDDGGSPFHQGRALELIPPLAHQRDGGVLGGTRLATQVWVTFARAVPFEEVSKTSVGLVTPRL